jgi:hypothetical protein
MAKTVLSILFTMGIILGVYAMYLKSLSGNKPGATPVAIESDTRVKMQLLNMAQAERTYFAQNSSYATMDQLVSSGWFTPRNPDPSGYSYDVSVATAPEGFTITATHPPGPNGTNADYPSMSINQDMQISGDN